MLCPLPRWTGPGALVGCFPGSCCLPRVLNGSASTTSLSRPAQALHTLRPVDSLDCPGQPLSQGFDTASYPAAPPASYRANRPLPGWDLHPQGDRALRGAPEHADGSVRFTGLGTRVGFPGVACRNCATGRAAGRSILDDWCIASDARHPMAWLSVAKLTRRRYQNPTPSGALHKARAHRST